MQDSHVCVNEEVKLGDGVHIEMLMNEEQFKLMELERVF
jgi:hypothetical protein